MKRTIAVFAAAAVLAAAACSQPVQPERFLEMRKDGGGTLGSGTKSDTTQAPDPNVTVQSTTVDTCETEDGGNMLGSGTRAVQECEATIIP